MQILFVSLVLGAVALTGCAGDKGGAATTPTASLAGSPYVLAPGEQKDYAGHPCGNPNMYVKMHPCVFPQKQK
jgi:hypothetical protein